MSLLKLFFIFVKIGAILLGGGYVILPIIISEFAQKRKLLSSDEICDYFALSQSLPGIVAANMSVFIGYKLSGKLGAITAITGIMLIPFWSIVILASVLNNIVNNAFVRGAFWGIGIAVIALIILTTRDMWQKSDKNLFFYSFFILALIFLLYLKATPVQTIIILTALGILTKIIIKRGGN